MVVTVLLLAVLMGTAVYFKRAAESLKSKALMGSESEASETEDASSYDDSQNPKVMVNKALLDRMTSISMKLKASVSKARSETSSSSTVEKKEEVSVTDYAINC